MFEFHKPERRIQFLFLVFLVVLNLPNFLWLSPHGAILLNGADFFEQLVPCLLIGGVFLALFKRPWLAWLVLWLLCLWWQPLALGVRVVNGTLINATLIGMALATSAAELRDLVAIIPSAWFILFIVWNLACAGFLCKLLKYRYLYWSWQFRGKVVFFCLCMLALPYIVLPHVYKTDDSWENLANSESDPLHAFAKADQSTGIVAQLPNAFPYELVRAGVQYWQSRKIVDSVRAHLQLPKSAFTLDGVNPEAEVVVMVVGESSTRNAWHWFNPQAPTTTPLLEARAMRGESLWAFKRTLAQTTSTREAVPSMFSAQPLVWPSGKANPGATRSIVSVASKAGYATAWFSNQAAIGKYDGVIASYAQEAEATAFLNPSSFSEQGSLDAVLLPALSRYLVKNSKAFIVLHTMGSHFKYAHRYPPGFGPYPKATTEREDYLNSVAYTDWILNEVIKILELDGRRSVLVYSSDHGETIPGGLCKVESARRSSRDAYEVPAFVWLSTSYAQSNPKVAEGLSAHQDQSYTVAAVHQTMLDLMRGDSQMPLPYPEVQSFLRPALPLGNDGKIVLSTWAEKFEIAVNRSPCNVNLK